MTVNIIAKTRQPGTHKLILETDFQVSGSVQNILDVDCDLQGPAANKIAEFIVCLLAAGLVYGYIKRPLKSINEVEMVRLIFVGAQNNFLLANVNRIAGMNFWISFSTFLCCIINIYKFSLKIR